MVMVGCVRVEITI